MEKYIINGGKKLYGKIRAESAKNAVLPLLACSVIVDGVTTIKNCPDILDVENMLLILKSVNVNTVYNKKDVIIDARDINSYSIPCFLMKELRSSVFMLGALLSRLKRAEIFSPGGCNIGDRPIDIHIDALKKLGVKITEEDEKILCVTNGCKGGTVRLKYPSVGATENVIMFACIGDSVTVIENAAREPEIEDLARFINACGGRVKGAGTDTVVIQGVKALFGTVYKPISDRIEIGTYIVASLICGGEICITDVNKKNLKNINCFVNKFCNNACKIYNSNDIIYIKSGKLDKSLKITTGPYPKFPTDMQPQTVALACYINGVSTITETVFENRFNYVSELKKLGADIELNGMSAKVKGGKRLNGGNVFAQDLRGGAALVVAALGINDTTFVNGVSVIKRGYYNLDKKLRKLGAEIKYVKG